YHIQKYLVAPAAMPEHLTWFKWESYWTWLSGFLMLAIVYYGGADLFLVDRTVMDISANMAIVISLASLGIGWLIYDALCKSPLGKSDVGLMLFLYVALVVMGWAYTQVFTGRAAFLHLGAFTATIMSANVFFIIIPNQKKVVAALKAGEKPDPALGKQAKQRSLHNNYLTLPVLFFMLSNHYPLAFATQYNWVIAALVFLIGVLIRHFFNSMHGRKGKPYWTFVAAAVIFAIIAWLSSFGATVAEDRYEAAVPAGQMAYVNSPHFETVRDTVLGRCSMCHAAEPVWEGIHVAPKNVMLDTDATIVAHAREIFLQAGASHAMPPGNVTEITPDERALIVAWFREAQ
ncbi:MAG: urate hydroxylase PuuD, partial [Notoacmeibacter sp.]|nr:urate hydroxylase PuuD [Notoacmeibacter sp.]